MNVNQFEILCSKLRDRQYRKSSGLITEQMLESLVRLVEATEKKLKDLAAGEEKNFTLCVTLAPKITEKEYDNLSYNTPVGYRGPYTVACYKNGEYRFDRHEGITEHYSAECKHLEGILLEVGISNRSDDDDSNQISLNAILGITGEKADSRYTFVFVSSDAKGALSLNIRIPPERIYHLEGG